MFSKRLLLIVNPVSGKKMFLRYMPQVVRIFMDAGYLVTTMVTAAQGEATDYAAEYALAHDLVVCTGGDGTLNEVLTGLARKGLSVPVGYIPCGSTNDFAVSRGLSSDILAAAEAIAHGRVTRYDVGRFGDHYFSYVAAFGAFSWLSYTTDQTLKNVLGHTAYILDGIKDLPKVKPYHVRLTADGTVYEGDYLFGAVCNSTSIAGTLELPRDRVDTCDGLFEVLLIHEPKTIMDLESILLAVAVNKDYQSPYVDFFRASDIVIENPPTLDWTVDGEFPGHYDRVEVSPLQGFLKLIS